MYTRKKKQVLITTLTYSHEIKIQALFVLMGEWSGLKRV
jgi:hypothetical protein